MLNEANKFKFPKLADFLTLLFRNRLVLSVLIFMVVTTIGSRSFLYDWLQFHQFDCLVPCLIFAIMRYVAATFVAFLVIALFRVSADEHVHSHAVPERFVSCVYHFRESFFMLVNLLT